MTFKTQLTEFITRWKNTVHPNKISEHFTKWMKLSRLTPHNVDVDSKITSTLHIEKEINTKQREIQQLQDEVKKLYQTQKEIYSNDIEKMRLENTLIPHLEQLTQTELNELGGLVDIQREIYYMMDMKQTKRRHNRTPMKSYL